jgi:hypothetical protein
MLHVDASHSSVCPRCVKSFVTLFQQPLNWFSPICHQHNSQGLIENRTLTISSSCLKSFLDSLLPSKSNLLFKRCSKHWSLTIF